ncbi:NADP-dependent oxidoreductase [Stutzerimonas stutzeri]|uniref:NADP-dependent oxidoreductase n=1 Tax=Stutzerimonas stutzeri TaxID=316 RepID=UPI00244AE4A2|nr:NADP-dependent oxidoreductase [Stutzerimonas stutzeri]MDH0425424.1 NADP-dependent oxidoreductase [Stutzerimonas stutzeri]
MSSAENLIVRYIRQAVPGPLAAETFALERKPLPSLSEGEILIRNIYLSIDAGSRAQFDDRADYVIKAMLGKVPGSSGAVGEVVESRHRDWQPGDLLVTPHARWQLYQVAVPTAEPLLQRIDPAMGPLAMHLGAMGMVGFTAYVGIFHVGRPQPGETLLVSAAAGATGALAGQFGRIAGARVVGIAGGADKCAFVREQLGFDDCIDYKAGNLDEAIRMACPKGVDVYYENVGGAIQHAAFTAMNDFGRIALCGQVGQYSGAGAQAGPNLMVAVLKRLHIQGFLAMDHLDQYPAFIERAAGWYREGRLQHHATLTQGLENIHEAINSVMSGGNIGKQLCQVSAEPDRRDGEPRSVFQ